MAQKETGRLAELAGTEEFRYIRKYKRFSQTKLVTHFSSIFYWMWNLAFLTNLPSSSFFNCKMRRLRHSPQGCYEN